MDFSTVATVGGLVNAAVSTAKTVRDLAKDSSDSALKASISDLHNALLDIKAKVLELDEENRSLKAQLAAKDDIEGPVEPHGYFFHKDKPEKPICPKCFQSQPQNIVYLTPLQDLNGNKLRRCLICHFNHIEASRQHSPIEIPRGYWS